MACQEPATVRDLLILILLTVGCVWTLRRPWIGAIMWTVVSLGSPHIYFGYASANWQVSMAVALCTMVGLVANKAWSNPFRYGVIIVYAVLTAWMTAGLPFSFMPEACYDLWDRTFKIGVMLIVSVALIDSRKKLDVFIWANVVSIAYYGAKGGVATILSGGSSTVLGPGGFIAENNALALAEIVVLPFLRYLQLQSANKWVRRALGGSMALVAISALGSQSRGALLGMMAMVGYFWIKSSKKFSWGLLIGLGAALVLTLMPAEYWARMDTIKGYEADDSSQGRINSWWAAFNIANDNFMGGGFRTNIGWVYERYAPNPRMLFVEHSIYFQMLGEFGWVGLFLFLTLGVMTWINAQKLIGLAKGKPTLAWAADLGAMVQVSMVGYAVTGAFLSLALFDLPYNVMVMAALGLSFARAQLTAAPLVAPPVPASEPEAGRRSPLPRLPSRPPPLSPPQSGSRRS
jgi:probable O-glycosylation ligase (exosortase A-associated)